MFKNHYGEAINIEIVSGGFIMSYPVIVTDKDGVQDMEQKREIFVSPRKLNQKIKDVIDALGLVADK